MEDFGAMSSSFAHYIGDLDVRYDVRVSSIPCLQAEPVLRAIETVCSLISWSLMASAKRSGYGGIYRYDRYTPLNFLLAAGILHWGFAMSVYFLKRSSLFDISSAAKFELYGTVGMLLFIYTAAVAGAASSTQNHDQFGDDDSSLCDPRKTHQSQRYKAEYFCSYVDASVVFAFFSTAAAAGSLAIIIVKQRNDQDGFATDAYNPIGASPPDGDSVVPNYPGAYNVTSIPMEGVGSDSVPQTKDAAVDL